MPLITPSEFHTACGKGDIDAVKRFLDQGRGVDEAWMGLTPLSLAAMTGRTGSIELLLDRSASISLPAHGKTPLMYAACHGRLATVKLLLERNARPDQQSQGWRALDGACNAGRLEAARLLLDAGAAVEPLASDGPVPLFLASVGGHVPVVKLLLARSANPSRINHQTHTSPLAAASFLGFLEIVAALLAAGADSEGGPAGEGSLTPLLSATMGKHAAVVRTLLEARADANRSASLADLASVGRVATVPRPRSLLRAVTPAMSPLMIAHVVGSADVAEQLRSHGAEPLPLLFRLFLERRTVAVVQGTAVDDAAAPASAPIVEVQGLPM